MRKIILSLAIVALAAGLASAGDSDEKCTASTQDCLNSMTKYWKEHGWVGVELDKADAGEGMKVTRVVADSPASAVGIHEGDVLIAMNGIELAEENNDKLEAERKGWTVGAQVQWTMLRDGKKKNFDITLASMPADVLAAWIGHHMMQHAELATASPTS